VWRYWPALSQTGRKAVECVGRPRGLLQKGTLAEPFGSGGPRDPAVLVVQEETGFPSAANASAGVERGLNEMSVRSRLLAEAEKQISNPFLMCALVSLRTRQLMMIGNANTSTAQLVDSALNELIAGLLEFERGKPRRPPLIRAESRNEESNGGLESPGVPELSRTLSAEAP